MFYHREKEIGIINNFFTSRKHGLLVYGKRRIGKTSLIYKALEDYKGIVVPFQCTSESYERNCKELTNEIKHIFNVDWISFDSFHDIFRFLIALDKEIIVVLDEYNELKATYGGLETDSMMQKILDSLKDTKVRVIVSGSAVSIMAELLEADNPLFDRFDVALKLQEFNYLEATSFYPSWSIEDKVRCYSIFGGTPAILEYINPEISLENNIKSLLLESMGQGRALVENTLLKEFSKIGPVLSILSRIGNGKRTYKELQEVFDQKNTGNLSRWLNKMVANDIISVVRPINEKENSKKYFYSISDNLFRFYFTFVHPNRARIDRIGSHAVYTNIIKPSIDTYISYRFEDISKQYLSILANKGKLPGILDIGSYWYNDKTNNKSGEFDIVAEYLDGYEVYECKFMNQKMELSLACKEEDKIRAIFSFKAKGIGFISIHGFDFNSNQYILIEGTDLYNL